MIPTYLNIPFQNALFPTGLFCKKQLLLTYSKHHLYFEEIGCIYFFICICHLEMTGSHFHHYTGHQIWDACLFAKEKLFTTVLIIVTR